MADVSNTTTEIVTAAWVAKRLDQSLRTVVRHANKGKLPTVGKIDGQRGAYLFDRAVIEQIAAQRKVLDDIVAANREAADSVRGAA